MRRDTLDVLRCPYCGGRLELVESSFHQVDGDEIISGILGCHCCVFAVVDGIPVMHLEAAAKTAYQAIEGGDPDRAVRTMFGLADDETAGRFAEAVRAPEATYRDVVEALGPDFEGGYFLYRFSDPTYLVAEAVVRGVSAAVLREGGRAVDLCGGSGHLTRLLLTVGSARPVLADLYYSKLWLARRFTAPGCEAVCCDGNSPMPFASGAFGFAVCSDAFHYIWTKRLFAGEMLRLAGERGAAVITHAHSANQWNPSAGMPLPPDAYRDLFEGTPARVFSERLLLEQVVAERRVDLGGEQARAAIETDPALTIVASARRDVFAAYAIPEPAEATGAWALNPLYVPQRDGGQVRLRLQFPSADYEQEYGAACRRYLPEEAIVDAAALAALGRGRPLGALRDLARRHVILDLPKGYC